MPSEEIKKISQKIKNIDEIFKTLEEDDEIVSHLLSYKCVLVGCFIEKYLKFVIWDFVQKNTNSLKIQAYINEKLIIKYKSDEIVKLFGNFDKEIWKNRIREYFRNNEEIKSAFDSIHANRNSVAHGSDHNIERGSLEKYYNAVKKGLEEIRKISQ